MKRVLFLDIDGVLNKGVRQSNGYYGIERDCVERLNAILREYPKLKIVISSAWRYAIAPNFMTLAGFKYMMLTHGLETAQRIEGYTITDDSLSREAQIMHYVYHNNVDSFVVLDDKALDLPELVQTCKTDGLTEERVKEVIARYKEHERAFNARALEMKGLS